MQHEGSAVAGAPSPRRRILGLTAGALILVFLGLALASGWEHVSSYDWRIRPLEAVSGVVLAVGMYAASAFGYILILQELTGRHVARRPMFAIWGRSLLGRYVPGNVMMVASRVVLSSEAGFGRRVSLAASVYEQALSLSAAAAGAIVLVTVYGAHSAGVAAWLVVLVPLGLLLLHPELFGRMTTWVLRRVGREPLEALLSVRQLVRLFGWYLVTSALLAVSTWLMVRSAAGPEAGGPAYVGLSFLLSFVLSMLAFVFPSGLGVREGVFALALARNLPGGVAIAVSAGTRLALTFAELLFVAIAVLLDRSSGQRGRRAETSSPK